MGLKHFLVKFNCMIHVAVKLQYKFDNYNDILESDSKMFYIIKVLLFHLIARAKTLFHFIIESITHLIVRNRGYFMIRLRNRPPIDIL